MTRRTALGLMAASSLAHSAGGRPIRLGGPIFVKSDDPEILAREHRRLGYSAAYCPTIKVEDSDRIKATIEAFRAQNVVLSEVGAWVNMLDPDSAKRKSNLDYVTSRLALAEALGARCCVDIAGSYHPTVWYGFHPKNATRECFDATVENCRTVIDAVKPKRTRFSIEMQTGLQPMDPDAYVRLLKAVDRSAFGVHMDICNGVNSPEKFYNSGAYIRECFQKLGASILSCHAKDLAAVYDTYNVHFAEVVPGRGVIDYAAYLTEVSKSPLEAPLMLEHLRTSQQYEEGKKHILKVGAELGLQFA